MLFHELWALDLFLTVWIIKKSKKYLFWEILGQAAE